MIGLFPDYFLQYFLGHCQVFSPGLAWVSQPKIFFICKLLILGYKDPHLPVV